MTLLRRFALGTFALGLVLLALGLVAACSGGESSPSNDDFESFDTSATHTPTVSATRTPTARPTATGTPEPPTPTPTPFAGDVAHIQLEAFGVDSLIEKIGVDSNNQLETPKDPHATGWYDIYDRPGWGGNAVFSAHVDYWPDIKGPFNRLDQQVEAANAGGVRINVGVTRQRIDKSVLCPPVIGEAAQVRDNEVNLRVLPGQQFADRDLAHHIVQHRQPITLRHLTNFAANARIIAMDFDPHKAETFNSLPHQRRHPPPIVSGVNKGKTVKAIGLAGHNPPYLPISDRVIRVKGSKKDRALNAGRSRPPQIFL